jgi:tRNA(fMet)-specific endonuclease VapC
MRAFDTDVLSELLADNPVYVARARALPPGQLAVPVVAAAEVLRGWLAAIRQAEAGRTRMTLSFAFGRFEQGLSRVVGYTILPYTPTAHAQYVALRAARIRIGTNDLRIAAICLDHKVTLVTRNARDYTQVPGLLFDVWT